MNDGTAGGLRFFTLHSPEAPNPFGVAMIEAIRDDIGHEKLRERDWSAVVLDSPAQIKRVGEGDLAVTFFDVLSGVNRWTMRSQKSDGVPIWAKRLSTGPCVALDLRRRTRLGMRLDALLSEEPIKSAARQIVVLLAKGRMNGKFPWENSPVAGRVGTRERADMLYRVNQQRLPLGQSTYFAK